MSVLTCLGIEDGRVALIERFTDGLHFSVQGVDPRGTVTVGDSVDTAAGPLASLVVTPSPVAMPTGGSVVEFTAFGFDANQNAVDVAPVWSIVEATPFASINAVTGVLTSGALGQEETITVRATVGSITADTTVTIADIVIDTLVVSPDTWNMTVGGTKTFSATGYSAGVAVTVAPVWSLVSGVGSVNASTGVYTAGTVSGLATIRATVDGITDDATIIVNAGEMTQLVISPQNPSVVGGAQQIFTVTGRDVYGNVKPFDDSPIQWFCHSLGSIISNGEQGILTAPGSDTTQQFKNAIEVTYKTFSALTDFTVTPGGGGGPPE